MPARSADKGVPKTAVLNADDPRWRYLADRAGGARVLTYAIDAHADVQGTILASDASGSRVRIASAGASVDVPLPLVGRFNVHNALAAAAAGLAAGATPPPAPGAPPRPEAGPRRLGGGRRRH